MDVTYPRGFVKAAQDETLLDERTRRRIVRAEAAMANGFEHIGIFAAAVVAGNVAKLNPRLLNGLSLGYIVSRLVYIFTLFIKAGNKLRHAVM